MAIQLHKQTNISSGALASRTTKLANNAKIAHALFTGIVKDKVGYPVREYAKNAWEVSPEGKPFILELPGRWSPKFRIRDFGPGLSHHFMMYKYAQLGESTKDGGGIGGISGWGFGSKSALAYLMEDGLSGSYTVISYRNLIASHYIISLDEGGMPEVKHFMDIDTTEPDGLEVSFAVREEDFNNFRESAKAILWSFEPRPVIKPAIDFGSPVIKAKGAGWTHYEKRTVPFSGPQVRVGPVMYPIDMDEISGSIGFLLPDDCIIFDVEDKAVSPTASREELQYTSGTKKSLSAMIQAYEANYVQSVQDKASAATCYFEACAITRDETQHLGVNRAAGVRDQISWGGQPVRVGIDGKVAHLQQGWSSFDQFRGREINPADVRKAKVVVEHSPYASLDRFIALDLVGQDILWARVKKANLPGFLTMCALKEDDVVILDKAPLDKRPNYQVGTRNNQVRRRRMLTITLEPNSFGQSYIKLTEGVETVDLAKGGVYLKKVGFYSSRKKDGFYLGQGYNTLRDSGIEGLCRTLVNLGIIGKEFKVMIDTNVDELSPDWHTFGSYAELRLRDIIDMSKLTPMTSVTSAASIDSSAVRLRDQLNRVTNAPDEFTALMDRIDQVKVAIAAEKERIPNQNDIAFEALMNVKPGLSFPTVAKSVDLVSPVNREYEEIKKKHPIFSFLMLNASGYGRPNRDELLTEYFTLCNNQKVS